MSISTCVARGPVARVDLLGDEEGYVVHFGPISIRLDTAALDSLLVTLIQAHEARESPGHLNGGAGQRSCDLC